MRHDWKISVKFYNRQIYSFICQLKNKLTLKRVNIDILPLFKIPFDILLPCALYTEMWKRDGVGISYPDRTHAFLAVFTHKIMGLGFVGFILGHTGNYDDSLSLMAVYLERENIYLLFHLQKIFLKFENQDFVCFDGICRFTCTVCTYVF